MSLKFSTRSGKYQGSTGLHNKNMFSFLRNHQTVFQSSYTKLQECLEDLVNSLSLQHLNIFRLLHILPPKMVIKWHLIVISICVFLIINEIGCVSWPYVLPATAPFESAQSANVTENMTM